MKKEVEEKRPMQLQIKPVEGGYALWLDDKRLHHVENYKIESSPFGTRAELSLKLLVQYPVNPKNDS